MNYIRFVLLPALILSLILSGCATSSKKPTAAEQNRAESPLDGELLSADETADADSILSEDQISESDILRDSEDAAVPESESKRLKNPQEIASQPVFDRALDLCEAAQDFWQKGELDNALQTLDQAYALIIDIDTSDNPKLIQQKEDLRFLISKRILEIYASRNIVVNGNHHAIPMTLNKHVQKEIDLFTNGGQHQKFFIEAYRRSGRYRPYIIKKLKQAGLPESLSWLPLIESGFKTGALSKARALGLWQFIPSTGYKFGLKRNMYIDERLDPVKSTEAAIDYLKELHQIFGDWTTVLAAYNCGEGRVLRTIRTQNVNYLDNFWDLYEKIPRETARYVPKFLATVHIIDNMEKYGLKDVPLYPPYEFETVEITRQVYLKSVAEKLDIPVSSLIDLNPELRHKMLPPDAYPLRIPKGKSETLLAAINDISVASPPQNAFVYHRVGRGQTLSNIAKRYGTTVGAITRLNRINRQNYIVAGRLLKIPQRGSTAVPVLNATSHVVRSGDSLWNIARRYGTTTTRIQEINNLKGTTLHVDQRLKLPGSAQTKPSANRYNGYTVKPGDSPYNIAVRHNMSLKHFLQINNLTRNSRIYPGQRLYVK
ncbi:MAG: LysM peptidoglycan-binding domain-containing protein [Desulfobacterales bacterium]